MVRRKGVVGFTRELLKVPWRSTQPVWEMVDSIRYRKTEQPEVLYAFYDLAVSGPSFDIMSFLVIAEARRKELGCSSLHIVIVPGPDWGFRAGDLESYHKLGAPHYDVNHVRWRLRNVLVPCCWLIPSCQHVTVCTSRAEAQVLQASLVKHVFPSRYTVRFPKKSHSLLNVAGAAPKGVSLSSIEATPQARRFVDDWIQNRANGLKVVTITLRECPYQRDRNSNLEAWGAFARSLDTSIYYPIVIRDTETAFQHLPPPLHGTVVFPEASWNVELRAALYEMSYLNMSVVNGTNVLVFFNPKAPYLIFKMITPSCGPTTIDHYREAGLEPGSQFAHATPLQRLVWEDDRLEVIQGSFREMCDRILTLRT